MTTLTGIGNGIFPPRQGSQPPPETEDTSQPQETQQPGETQEGGSSPSSGAESPAEPASSPSVQPESGAQPVTATSESVVLARVERADATDPELNARRIAEAAMERANSERILGSLRDMADAWAQPAPSSLTAAREAEGADASVPAGPAEADPARPDSNPLN